MTRWRRPAASLATGVAGLLIASTTLACAGDSPGRNPAGYPPQPLGQAARAAPTPGGQPPVPVGSRQSSGQQEEQGGEQAGTSALGPGAGDPGIYEAMNGSGSAYAGPSPVPTQTPRPVATVTIGETRGFQPVQVTIRKGEAVMWTNTGRMPQTVTADPARATDGRLVALPAGAEPWSSGPINPGDSYIRQFEVEGEYLYFSTALERRDVVGRVVVQP